MTTLKQSKQIDKPANLHKLIVRTSDAHKEDIRVYTSGHLNYNKLLKPDTSTKKEYWKSSKKKTVKPKSPKGKFDEKKLEQMSTALIDFSLGSSGVVAINPQPIEEQAVAVSHILPSASETQFENRLINEMEELMIGEDFSYPYVKSKTVKPSTVKPILPFKKTLPAIKQPQLSKVCVEELKVPEIMLPVVSSTLGIPLSMQPELGSARFSGERRKFLTTHLAGITRKDQFQKMIDFEESVLKRPELLEKNVRDGHKAVEHLENKLVNRLVMLQMKQPLPGPSFERLQLYSEIWCDMTMDSSIFGNLLSEIKEEYDNYLTHLLDTMKTSNRGELAQCLHAMEDLSSEQRTAKAEALHLDVENLEDSCRDALLKNLDLHEQIAVEKARIEEEKRLQAEEDEENLRRMLPVRRKLLSKAEKKYAPVSDVDPTFSPPKLTTEQQLKSLRADIWDRIDTLNEQKRLLRIRYVPKPLHRNIQHAIKDTELELQKLQQQNAYLMQHKQELLEHLNTGFQSRHIDDHDIRDIWKIIDDES